MGISRGLTSKVSTKIWSGFIVVLLIMAFVVGFSYVQLSVIDKKMLELEEKRVVNVLATEALALATADQITATLGYLLTGDRSFLIELEEKTELAEEKADLLDRNVMNQEKWIPVKNSFNTFKLGIPEMIRIYDTQGKDAALVYLLGIAETNRRIFFNDIDGYIDYQEGAIGNDVNEVQDITTNLVRLSLILLAVALIFGIIIAAFISRIISRPLVKLREIANKLAGGDLDVEIDVSSKDEIGALAQAFAKMADNTNDAMTNISVASEQVASGSGQVSDSSMALSQGAAEQASSIEELTASLEEVSSQTKLNAEHANEANRLSELAMNNAKQGDEQMEDMLEAMENINASSSNISKIIKVIDEIAFQTNILALNAAVEAARAGQHGKGFAVVAEEVRNLAARSANAAKETTDMIEESIKRAEGGTKIAQDTAKALEEIVEGIAQAAKLVGDIAVASNEQASAIEQINQGVMQISQVVQNNSATAEESAAASEELSGQADLLRETVGHFKLKRQAQGLRDQSSLYNKGMGTDFKAGKKDYDRAATKKVKSIIHKETIPKEGNHGDDSMDESEDITDFQTAAASEVEIELKDNDFGKY